MRCCVPGCTSANLHWGGVKMRHYSFFRFPVDVKEAKEWREILKVKEVPGVSQKICEKHFEPKYLEALPGNKKRLDWRAVPMPAEHVKNDICAGQIVDKPKRKAPDVKSEFFKVLQEYKRAKEKYFNLLGIPKEFEDDFDDAEYFGIHYDGLPWWARPVVQPSSDEDVQMKNEDENAHKKLCQMCGKLEVNHDLHMLLFHPPEIKADIEVEEVQIQDGQQIVFEELEQDIDEPMDTDFPANDYDDDDDDADVTPVKQNAPDEKSESGQKYMCSCFKILPSINALVDHISKARDSYPAQMHNLECTNCQSQFKDLGLFKRHIDADGTLCFKSANLVAFAEPLAVKRVKAARLRALNHGVRASKLKECGGCGMMFPLGQSFMEHQRTVHGIESADELVNYLMEPTDFSKLDEQYSKEIEHEEKYREKVKYFREMDIPREFMHDFDDPEEYGHHEGLPWWAMPVKIEEHSETRKKSMLRKMVTRKTRSKDIESAGVDENAEDDDNDEDSSFRYVQRDRKDLCQYCGHIRAHINKHINLRHLCKDKPCDDCGQPISLMKEHTCIGYPRRRNKYNCTCGEGFKLIETLHAHVNVENGRGRGIHRFKCGKCNESYDNKTDFDNHVLTHAGIYQCDLCKKTYQTSSSLKAHLKIHTEERKYPCEICGQRFKKKIYAENHLELVHRQVPVPCPHCFGMFKPGLSLNNHIQRQHLNRRDYVCDICQKSFNSLGALKYHLTIHTGERPHPCPFCHQAFKTNKDLRRHYANHKDLTIKCPMCKNHFLNEEELKEHCNRYHRGGTDSREQVIEQIDYITEEIVDDMA